MVTRSKFTVTSLIMVVIATLILSISASAAPPADPYADAVDMVNGSGMLNVFELQGEPDNGYATIVAIGGDFLIMDMGEGEEGTGDLIIHHGPVSLASVGLTLDFLDADHNVIASDWVMIDISVNSGTVTADYDPSPLPAYTPYRYVRFNAPITAVKLDALEATTYRPDSDGDGLPDEWEIEHGLDPLDPNDDNGPDGDPDNDGLTNEEEYILGTDPQDSDSDDDSLPDGWEVDNSLDPMDATGMNGMTGDPDNDGLVNGAEQTWQTHPNDADTDDDTLPDGWEAIHNLHPLTAMGIYGADGDPDHDDLNNAGEYQQDTDPWNWDTDDDTYSDGWEVTNGHDPLDPSDPGSGQVVTYQLFLPVVSNNP